ncbi:MAG: hypothetical protein IPM66_03790 [Acidobacteriota bacterium]|nr:MAG: hypothetical protein IPM66_03790 [Acidobacteriota bacterium]
MKNTIKGIACCLMIIIAVLVIMSDGSHAQKAGAGLSNAECLACHSNEDLTKEVGGKQVSVHVSEAKFGESVHGSLDCATCHTDVKDYPHDPTPQKVTTCSTCHGGIDAEHQTSIHATSKGNGPAAGCADCHGSHEIFPRSDSRSKVNRFKIAETCAGCHTNPDVIKKFGLPPASFIHQFRESSHGRGMFSSGLSVSATCSDCHGAHTVRKGSDPESQVSRVHLPETCSKCHQGILNDFVRSSHGKLWKAGDVRGPDCSTCHSSHEIKRTDLAAFQTQTVQQCGTCHQEQTETYHDTFHGKATSLGLAVAAKCSDCHTAHLNLPKSDPLSTVSQANLQQTCARCHAGATAGILSFNPHPEPEKKEKSALLYYVYKFMEWLLISVFTFFGIHTLLWFQRSIGAWIRNEIPKIPEDGQWVTRFVNPHRITHILIVVSFIGLALTGIPLRFSGTEWGQVVSSILGGVEVSRFFHRVWAVVTFGYALYHLYFLFKTILVKGDRSILYGFNSMIPRKQDFIDFFNMVRWFLYLGPRPKLDRWTYWEKFDYYAVFWGIPVIGLSGLVLWFPWFFTKFLPGSFLNIAMIIHGEEALLAVGFIFTFHFFHNHLRPENFPMDTTVFTGKMTLERFKDERPIEYERMESEGRLQEILSEPPTRMARRLSFWFGLMALILGLIVAAAIFITVFFG